MCLCNVLRLYYLPPHVHPSPTPSNISKAYKNITCIVYINVGDTPFLKHKTRSAFIYECKPYGGNTVGMQLLDDGMYIKVTVSNTRSTAYE